MTISSSGVEILAGTTTSTLDFSTFLYNDIDLTPTILSGGNTAMVFVSSSGDIFSRIYDPAGQAVTDLAELSPGTARKSTPSVVAFGDGFAVAWEERQSDGSHIVMQRYSATGTALGSVQDLGTSSSLFNPGITTLSDGRVLAVWESFDGSYSLSGRFVNGTTGAPEGNVFALAAGSTSAKTDLNLTALDGGGFVAVWLENGPTFADKKDVMVQVFNNQGAASSAVITANVAVANIGPGDQFAPVVETLSDGSFFVAWWGEMGVDGSSWGTFAQKFSATGVKSGTPFVLNQTTSNQQWEPVLKAVPGGGFVAVWQSTSQDGSGEAIVARHFDNDGLALDDEFIVNTSTAAAQWYAGIDISDDGHMAVTW